MDTLKDRVTNLKNRLKIESEHREENEMSEAPAKKKVVVKKKAASDKSEAPPKAPAKKDKKEGIVTLDQLATELKMRPRDARRILRDAGVEKPEGEFRYQWKEGSKDLANVTKVLTKAKASDKGDE